MLKNRFRPSFETLENRLAPASFKFSEDVMVPSATVLANATNQVVFSGKIVNDSTFAHNLIFEADKGSLQSFSPGYTLFVFGGTNIATIHAVPIGNYVTFNLQTGIPSGDFTVKADKVSPPATTFHIAYRGVEVTNSVTHAQMWVYPAVDILHDPTLITTFTVTSPPPIVPSPTLVVSATTPSQYIAAAGGATNATQFTVNFTSTGGGSTLTDLRFLVKGSDSNLSQTIARVDVNTGSQIVSAFPTSVNGVEDIWIGSLNVLIPSGGSGVTLTFTVSYATVGANGIASGTTSQLSLEYMGYSTGSNTHVLATSTISTALGITPTEILADGIASPIYTLVGAKPTVTVTAFNSTGLSLGSVNKICEITVTAIGGDVKINDLVFSINCTGFVIDPTFTGVYIVDGTSGVTPIVGSSCGAGVAHADVQTVIVEFGNGTLASGITTVNTESNTDYDGYTVLAGTSKTFSLYALVSGAFSITGGSLATTFVAAKFSWDDTSMNGAVGSTNFNGTLLVPSPTNAWIIKQ